MVWKWRSENKRRGEDGRLGLPNAHSVIPQAAQLCYSRAAKCGSARESCHTSTEAGLTRLGARGWREEGREKMADGRKEGKKRNRMKGFRATETE